MGMPLQVADLAGGIVHDTLCFAAMRQPCSMPPFVPQRLAEHLFIEVVSGNNRSTGAKAR